MNSVQTPSVIPFVSPEWNGFPSSMDCDNPLLESLVLLINPPSFITGWWYTYPSKKDEFVSWGDYSHILWKIKNVPNQ